MPREFPRSRRVEEQIQRVLGEIFRARIRDPRLDGVIVTAVKASRDISVARIYYTTFDEGSESDVQAAIASASGFIRSQLASELNVRHVPELRFVADETARRGAALDELIDDAIARDRAGSPDSEEV